MKVAELLEAARVMPSKEGVDRMREILEVWDAMAHSREEKQEAETLRLLIELADKIRAAAI